MDQDQGPCTHCGAVLPLARLLRVDHEGRHVALCQGCALATPTGGQAPRSR